MGLTSLNNIVAKIASRRGSLFTYPVAKQEKYIRHFPEPKDEIERSYFQYCCQMNLHGKLLHWAMNLAALPVSIFLLNKYKKKTISNIEKADCVFIREELPENLLPCSVRQTYEKIESVYGYENSLTPSDMVFLKGIFRRYPLSWIFWLKIIIKVSQYSALITQYDPQAIVSCSEFSFTSSAITKYCRTKGIKSINVMHGEKLYYMRDSFMEYDAYYVWDQYYVDLLTELRANKDQFRVELPGSMRIQKQDDISIQYDYTCYLQNENEETLRALAGALRSLYDQGKRISVRPHPRYSDMTLVGKLLDFANIEDCKTVTIEQSLLQTGAAISLYSTVLNQAVSNSIPVVIDDISNPERFKKLKELRYACLSKEHTLLSEIAKNA